MIAEQAPSERPSRGPAPDWDAIERSADFKALVAAKWRFMLPAAIFFLTYYFALPVLTGYAPDLMKTPVLGPVNIANLFALSQFAMVAIVMSLYVSRAKRYDEQAARLARSQR